MSELTSCPFIGGPFDGTFRAVVTPHLGVAVWDRDDGGRQRTVGQYHCRRIIAHTPTGLESQLVLVWHALLDEHGEPAVTQAQMRWAVSR